MALPARLDKTGMWVHCWKQLCRGKLAYIEERPSLPPLGLLRLLVMAAGWEKGPDDVWRLADRARGRLAQGLEAGWRRRLATKGERSAGAAPRSPSRYAALPSRAQCPRCGEISMLAADALRVNADWEPADGLVPYDLSGQNRTPFTRPRGDWTLEQYVRVDEGDAER
jgi:hypothetical protein